MADEARAVEVAAAKDEMRKEMAKVVADAEEARGAMAKLNEKVQELHRDVADKESLVVQANVRVQLGQQEAMELRAKTEEWRVACATTQQQLKTKVASLEASEQRVAAQEQELNELRSKVSESQPAGENEVKLLKAQLMKAQLDKKALQTQLDAKVADNASLSAMCDELLQQMESSKS
jgi:chromosome segregation ATPase